MHWHCSHFKLCDRPMYRTHYSVGSSQLILDSFNVQLTSKFARTLANFCHIMAAFGSWGRWRHRAYGILYGIVYQAAASVKVSLGCNIEIMDASGIGY